MMANVFGLSMDIVSDMLIPIWQTALINHGYPTSSYQIRIYPNISLICWWSGDIYTFISSVLRLVPIMSLRNQPKYTGQYRLQYTQFSFTQNLPQSCVTKKTLFPNQSNCVAILKNSILKSAIITIWEYFSRVYY